MNDPRPGWDEYFMHLADSVAIRADCTRRRVGAVIVRDHRVVATGYNGAPAGKPGCLSAGACPRGRHHPRRVVPEQFKHSMGIPPTIEVCICGHDWPCPESAQPGSSYDTGPGACISLHAELNAIVYAGREACLGSTLYITDDPCEGCKKVIRAAGIAHVRTPDLRWDL